MSPQSQRWVVLKFGGTSVSRRNRWDTIGRIAAKRMVGDEARVLVVVSALSGVTNELQAIANGDGIDGRIAGLVERHRAFCAELDLDADAVLRDFTPRDSKNFFEKHNDETYALQLPFRNFKCWCHFFSNYLIIKSIELAGFTFQLPAGFKIFGGPTRNLAAGLAQNLQ